MSERAVGSGASAAPHVPQLGLVKLRFPPELETEYRRSRHETERRWARMSLYVALSTVLGFAVIDHWVLPGPIIGHSDLVRFGLHLPLVLSVLVLTREPLFARWYQPCVQVGAPLFGLGIIIMATQASPEHLPLISARLLLVTFFFYFMLALSLAAALRTNLMLVAAYAVAAVIGAVPGYVATYQLFVLFCANLIGAAGCYALERANRMAFLDRRRLAHVAMHDGLTGLLNRAALEEQVRPLWQRAARDRLPVSVILIDIDHFKAYNDRYGHQAGDECLRNVAVAVRRTASRGPLDLVARYGGEEIIAVLFGADRAHAETIAHSVVDKVRELRIPHAASPTCPYVTASVGAATLAPAADVVDHAAHDHAVQMADQALYTTKARGRNGATFFDAGLKAQSEGADPLRRTAS
jgi:diguanylate cyclase (GGDEF)-like protein